MLDRKPIRSGPVSFAAKQLLAVKAHRIMHSPSCAAALLKLSLNSEQIVVEKLVSAASGPNGAGFRRSDFHPIHGWGELSIPWDRFSARRNEVCDPSEHSESGQKRKAIHELREPTEISMGGKGREDDRRSFSRHPDEEDRPFKAAIDAIRVRHGPSLGPRRVAGQGLLRVPRSRPLTPPCVTSTGMRIEHGTRSSWVGADGTTASMSVA
jgi:hypothetical protein